MLKNVLFAVLTLCITLIAFYWSGSSLSWAVSWLPFNRRNRLVVAVLSARSHFTNRDAIRRTWASDKANQDIRVLFFVGDNSCPIPRSHLQHLYACSARLVRPDELSQKVHSLQSHTLIGNHESLPAVDRRQMYGGFAFRTLFNIRLQAVGVLECVFANRKHVKSISIQLRDAFTQKRIKLFEIDRYSNWSGGYLFDESRFVEISAGNTIEVLAESILFPDDCKDCKIHIDQSGLIDLIKVVDDDFTRLQQDVNRSLSLISIRYSLKDDQELENVLRYHSEFEQAAINHQRMLNEEEQKLKREIELNRDVIELRNHQDTYRNLPNKLIHAIKYVKSNYDPSLFLKTDDDVYLNLPLILKNIDFDFRTWFGSFRKHWQVYHYGKWAELNYQSLTYPPFACGAGHVMTNDLITWIASNSNHLRRLQGEDVSLGVWLAALNVNLEHDNRWLCNSNISSKNFFSTAQLSNVDQFFNIHRWLTDN